MPGPTTEILSDARKDIKDIREVIRGRNRQLDRAASDFRICNWLLGLCVLMEVAAFVAMNWFGMAISASLR